MVLARKLIGILTTFGLLAGAASIFADTIATPCSYKVESADKGFFAVVFAPEKAKKYECISQGPDKKKEADELRKKYPSSGVYKSSSL